MKKLLAFLLSLCLLGSALAACDKETDTSEATTQPPTESTPTTEAPLVESPAEDFQYEENNEGGITITKYVGQDGKISIPSVIQNKPVTKVGFHSFGRNVATSVRIPDTVTVIEDGAFQNCDRLKEIVFSRALTEIGQRAFENCSSLKHIKIPSGVKSLGEMVFYRSGIESVELGEGIEVIPSYGFASTNLVEVRLPKSVKTIEYQAFAACSSLQTVVLNEGLVTIEQKAFAADITLEEIVIPKTVINITEMVFSGCSALKKVIFKGTAPASYEYSDSISGVWEPFDVFYTIYYYGDTQGFTTPEWYGYPTQMIK